MKRNAYNVIPAKAGTHFLDIKKIRSVLDSCLCRNDRAEQKMFTNKPKPKQSMSRVLALAMTRPHERLGLPKPIGRRLPQGLVGWNMLLAVVTVCCVAMYVVQVNRAASRGYALRETQNKVDKIKSDVTSLEDSVATLSSLQALSDRASALGFVAVDRLEFANPAGHSYAMAR